MSTTRASSLRWIIALGAVCLATRAFALAFVFTDQSGGVLSAPQLASLNVAASYFTRNFSDNVTVNIAVRVGNLGPCDLGTGCVEGNTHYNTFGIGYPTARARLASDATSSADRTAVGSLQPGDFLSFLATNANGSERFDNDRDIPVPPFYDNNNFFLNVTRANAKALGYNLTGLDGTITINAAALPFLQASRDGGIAPDKLDLTTIWEHEIGHVLGFVSGVEIVDGNLDPSLDPFAFDVFRLYSMLDLFRYSAPGVLDLRVGHQPYFSIDGGVTSIVPFSSGVNNGGDGWGAAHFYLRDTNLMNPALFPGESFDLSPIDITAFDVIGWNRIPEPGVLELIGLGCLLLAGRSRRRRISSDRAIAAAGLSQYQARPSRARIRSAGDAGAG